MKFNDPDDALRGWHSARAGEPMSWNIGRSIDFKRGYTLWKIWH